jgi:hypothetical protein
MEKEDPFEAGTSSLDELAEIACSRLDAKLSSLLATATLEDMIIL